ncbi:DUF998 domain-containing protein [Halostella salina]|uniref:DUF998 domain-containing protein n=1 Tax=Halostella salina TaxID=1547897 RepID=UPI000EF7B27E|nr:DUF998 domain-containing protein [Halostella salina]
MTDLRRVAAATGLVAPIVAVGSFMLATLVSPSFTWAGAALSDMGRPGEPTYWLFNGGLVVAGVVGVPFAYALAGAARNAVHRAGVAAFVVAVVCMGLVGVLHLPRAGHGAVAIGHYLFATVTMLVWGAGDLRAGERRRGLATVGLGVGHVAMWVGWGLTLAPAYFAAAEAAGAAMFAGWLLGTARLLSGSLSRSVSPAR